VGIYEFDDTLDERDDDMCDSDIIIIVSIPAINNNRSIHKFVSGDDDDDDDDDDEPSSLVGGFARVVAGADDAVGVIYNNLEYDVGGCCGGDSCFDIDFDIDVA
jgi:hypothetical protein